MSSYRIIDTGINNPDVSIAMLAYNHCQYIEKAIEGVLMQQTTFSYKIIIAEDYSTDNTREIIMGYQQKYPDKFKLILQEKNVGPQQNNHDLLVNLEGKYIAALEGDDYWIDVLKLQKQLDYMEQNPEISFTFHAAKTLENNGNFGTHYKHPRFFDRKTVDTRDFLQKAGASFCTASAIFKKKILDRLPQWFIEAHIGDYPLMFLALENGKIGYLADEMCVYREKVKGGWTAKNISLSGRLRNFKKMVALNNEINKQTHGKYKKYLSLNLGSYVLNKAKVWLLTKAYQFS